MKHTILLSAVSFFLLNTTCCLAQPQEVTLEQAQTLLPNGLELQGFVQARAIGISTTPEIGAEDDFIGTMPIVPRSYIPYNAPLRHAGTVTRISRGFFSSDGAQTIGITLKLCDSPQTAHEDIQNDIWGAQMAWKEGSLTVLQPTGDESWTPVGSSKEMLCRFGRMVVLVRGSVSPSAKNGAVPIGDFPSGGIEAIAYQILLRAAQQPQLTGVTAQQASLAVNGHSLPKGALLVAGQTYVPVQEFAKAMGLTSRWDARTGALTLSGAGRKPVALTAGSTAAMRGGVKAASLTVPVLKQGGLPVMTLADLLSVTGGRVVSRDGGGVRIKG